MTKKFIAPLLLTACFFSLIAPGGTRVLYAQVTGPQVIKWMRVSELGHWFSNGGAEIEYGRQSRSFLTTDQLDGMNWPAEYTLNKGVNVGQSMWIGTTNFNDPVAGKTFPYKVVCAGRLYLNLNTEIFPAEFSLVGRFARPGVYVDNESASAIAPYDNPDKIDPSIPCDRMITNTVNTTIGLTMKRRVLAFTQQYHNNYFIYEYTFVNTGIIDNAGTTLSPPRNLTGVVIHFQYRLAFPGESYLAGWSPTGSSWGRNTINDCFSPLNPGPSSYNLRACWEYYGPVYTPLEEDMGLPNISDGSVLAGTNFAGAIVLHADRSAQDHSDDPAQPFDTYFMGQDQDAQGNDQYDATLMTQKYNFMTRGHAAKTHAQQVGADSHGWPTVNSANTWGNDNGGYASAQGFGPYTLSPGDSVRIVIAQGVAGIMSDRDFVRTVARNWYTNNTAAFRLPDGGTTTNRNEYKNSWVWTGKDSLMQTFLRAVDNYSSNYGIPQPPAPPANFSVNSGGSQISLSWDPSPGESSPHFKGYLIWRAEGRTDSTYTMIKEVDKNTHYYGDKTPRRGFNYYYYIQSEDDGSTNNVQPGVPLVSSKFYTMTALSNPAFLTRLPGNSLSDIRIVPNPYNVRARSLQFGTGLGADRIAFYGLPPFCAIRIYTESGDLIKTINHTNQSGSELWHSLTSSNQIIVSGLYIAYFEATEDYTDPQTGKLLIKKGDHTIRKFIVIR